MDYEYLEMREMILGSGIDKADELIKDNMTGVSITNEHEQRILTVTYADGTSRSLYRPN